MTIKIPQVITFAEAIHLTQVLLDEIENKTIKKEEIEKAIASLVKTKDGARGFFVAYLSDNRSIADHPSPEVISALQASPQWVSELLVKNLVMSTAMTVTHSRDNNEEMVHNSARVAARSAALIIATNLDLAQEKLQQMYSSLQTGEGEYSQFLTRWQYDHEQRQKMREAIEKYFHL